MSNRKLYEWCVEHRHPIFLVGLILFFIVPEVFEKIFLFPLPPQLIFILLVVSSMLLIQTTAKYRFVPYAIVLGLVALATRLVRLWMSVVGLLLNVMPLTCCLEHMEITTYVEQGIQSAPY